MLSRQYGGAALGSLLSVYRSRRHLSWEEPLRTQGPTLGVTAPGNHSGAAQAGRSGRAWARGERTRALAPGCCLGAVGPSSLLQVQGHSGVNPRAP